MSGYRMSMLPVTQYCGAAGELAKGRGAGRAAAMSTAFHAKCAAKTPEESNRARELWARLSDAEQLEVLSWALPANVEVYPPGAEEGGVNVRTLLYADAHKEIALGLDFLGNYTDDEANAHTWGHMDFGWIVTFLDGTKVAYVEDIKKSVWTTSEGPESLQLHSYGRAFALAHGCSHYVTGLWLATEGEHLWASSWVDLSSPRADALWDRIYHAADNVGEYSTGDHCDGCWQRLHCAEHVLPAALAETFLKPVAEGQVPTPEEAGELLQRLQRAEAVFVKAKENLAQWVRRGELKVETEKKTWRPIETTGRIKVDMVAVDAALQVVGKSIGQFQVRGPDYVQMRWVNK